MSTPNKFTENKIYKLEEILLSYNPRNQYIFKQLENGFVYDSKELGPDFIFVDYKPNPVFLNNGKQYCFYYEIKSYAKGINKK